MFPCVLFSQSFRSLNNKAIDDYHAQKFQEAEIGFRKSINTDSNKFNGHFNLGDAYYRQRKGNEALGAYETALKRAQSNEEKAFAYHNIGNTYMKLEKVKEAVDAYKNALKLNPKDKDTKYNLAYAMNMLKNPPEQKQNKDKDQNKNQDKDKNKDNQNKNDQNKNDQNDKNKNDKNDQNKQKDQNDQQQNQPQSKEQQMKKEQAEKMLEAVKNNEKDIQKKLRKKVGVRVKTEKDW